MNNANVPNNDNSDASELINPSFLNDGPTNNVVNTQVPNVQPEFNNVQQTMSEPVMNQNMVNNMYQAPNSMMNQQMINNTFSQTPNPMMNQQMVNPQVMGGVSPQVLNNVAQNVSAQPVAAPVQQPIQNNAGNVYQAQTPRGETAISRILDGTDDKLTEDEELLLAFMSKNSEKFLGKKFNFAGFFFGSLYFYYRKMISKAILLSVLSFGLTIFLSAFIKSPFLVLLIYILIAIMIGFATNNNYVDFAQKQVAKIKEDNPNATKEQLISICKKEGGTSAVWVILGMLITGAISSAISTILTLFGMASLLNEYVDTGLDNQYGTTINYDNTINYNDTNNNINTNTNTNTNTSANSNSNLPTNAANDYNGAFVYTGDDITDKFTATPLKGYESEDFANGIHYDGTGIEYQMNGLQKFNNAEMLANSVFIFYKKNYDDSVKVYMSNGITIPSTYLEPVQPEHKTVNGIDWYVVRNYSFGAEEDCFTQKGNTVYLLNIKAENKEILDKNESQILNSIKSK